MAVSLPPQPPKKKGNALEEGVEYEGYSRKRKRTDNPPTSKSCQAPLTPQLSIKPKTEEPSFPPNVDNQPSLKSQLGYDLGDDYLDFDTNSDFDSDPDFDFKVTDRTNQFSKPNNDSDTKPNDVFYYDIKRTQRSTEPEPLPEFISAPNQQMAATNSNVETSYGKGPPPPVADPEPELCAEQQELVDLIMSGSNVFYTGSAGCGKSTVLKAAVKKLNDSGSRVEIVAPTGISALQVDGQTTWSYMGWSPDHFQKKTDELQRELRESTNKKRARKRLRKTDVLILDEISMVENHHLERMNRCMKAVRSSSYEGPYDDEPPFGGVQVIVTGDFCQLAPVQPFQYCMECGKETYKSSNGQTRSCPDGHGAFDDDDKWAFRSRAWEECKFIHFHLKEIHRQSDSEFIRILQKCRLGFPFTPAEEQTLLNHECNVTNATRLYCKKKQAQDINHARFQRLATQKVTYLARDGSTIPEEQGAWRATALSKLRDHRMEPEVKLKVGMLVILQTNLNLRRGLCNGSMGIISGFEPVDMARLPQAKTKKNESIDESLLIYGDHAHIKEREIRKFAEHQRYQKPVHWPRVMFHNGEKRVIYPECSVNTFGDSGWPSLIYRTQIPLIAGWAMTIHKSQGMTLERVIVNLEEVFEEKQVYVALSRAKNLRGLKVEGSAENLAAARGGSEIVMGFLRRKFPTVFHQRLEG